MIEICTGRLALDQLDDELLAVADDLRAFGHDTVFVSCGFGCHHELLTQWQDVPVAVPRLIEHITELESMGVYELGEADLFVGAGRVEFRICHESDVHCSGDVACRLVSHVRRRWTQCYEHSSERQHKGPWRRLARRRGPPESI